MSFSTADMQYGIVGAGQLGRALAVSLGSAVAWIANRGEERRMQMRSLQGDVPLYTSVAEIGAPADCVILAVSDSAVVPQAELCARHWQAALAGRFVVHCSGTLTREALDACSRWGAHAVAAHPFQTIASSSPDVLTGAVWGVEAGERDRGFARRFVERVGGTAFFLSAETQAHKALYHAAAASAANYLTVLAACAADLAAAAGIPASLFLPPIMHRALDNALSVSDNPQKLPLTGPIARADVGTLSEHIRALRAHPHLLREYCLLGLAAAELAMRRGVLDTATKDVIANMFYAELGDNHASP